MKHIPLPPGQGKYQDPSPSWIHLLYSPCPTLGHLPVSPAQWPPRVHIYSVQVSVKSRVCRTQHRLFSNHVPEVHWGMAMEEELKGHQVRGIPAWYTVHMVQCTLQLTEFGVYWTFYSVQCIVTSTWSTRDATDWGPVERRCGPGDIPYTVNSLQKQYTRYNGQYTVSSNLKLHMAEIWRRNTEVRRTCL